MSVCDVSIVMLAHNGAEFTRHALEGILAAETHPWEMFLVDNCSDDATPELIREFEPRFREAGIAFTTWRNGENKGCSLARNEAWVKATSRYTVLIDNDAVVCTRDWLAKFIRQFEEHERLGIVGAKMIYPYQPHRIQCAGVGLLDELFHPVQYEDLDLCVRARLKGYEVAYTPDVEMYHFEGITTASFGQDEYKVNIARNSLKFRERYHELFRTFTDELPAEEFRWLKRSELGLRPELDLALC